MTIPFGMTEFAAPASHRAQGRARRNARAGARQASGDIVLVCAEDIRTMFAGPIPAMMRKDEESFVQMDALAIRAVCEEHRVTA